VLEKSNKNYGSLSLRNVFMDSRMEPTLDRAKSKQAQSIRPYRKQRINRCWKAELSFDQILALPILESEDVEKVRFC